MIALVRNHTDAIIAKLLAEVAGTEVTIGDGDAEGLKPPYMVVYSIQGGEMSGSLERPFEDADLVYQVTCVGETREQAEWVADRAMSLLEGFVVTDRNIALVSPEGGPGTRVDRDVDPPVFISTPRFTVKSTPA